MEVDSVKFLGIVIDNNMHLLNVFPVKLLKIL